MILRDNLNKSVDILNIDPKIINKLKKENIVLIKDLWVLNRKDLKKFNITDSEINKLIIGMQLLGFDLNKRIYN